jgi:uncharacterized protein (TIGR02646 family)
MIRVDRTQVPQPRVLTTKAAEAERARARQFYRRPAAKRAQETFDFDPALFAAEEVRTALDELFYSKCAYCEQPLPPDAQIVDHFRPRAGAVDLDGSFDLDHYWWLAYEWANLYASCTECASLKGLRFPVEGARAKPPRAPSKKREITEPVDRGVLLDPCADDPEQHLLFLDDGQVAGTTDRGRVTIEVLGLNRTALLEARRAALESARVEWDEVFGAIASPKQSPGSGALESLFDVTRPFAALRRQFVNEWSSVRPTRVMVDSFLAETEEGPSSVEELAPEAPIHSKASKRAVRRSFEATQAAQESYSVEQVSKKEDYFIRSRLIDRIVVHNLKVVKDLELTMPTSSDPDLTAWLTLLGENGSGKSTVLQAVGLALMGKKYRDALKLDASTYVRHRAESGYVDVYLTGGTEPIHLEFSASSKRFKGSPAEPKVLLLGYGATRLLPRGNAKPQSTSAVARVDNLFNPFVPLGDAHTWLLGLDPKSFSTVARRLKKLLFLAPQARFGRDDGRVEVSGLPLEQLSDGSQSVLALAADIISVMISRWSAMEAAEGIVLIDELGAHLHPRWRMRIVTSLREVFPRVQFLVSTHDPLCLRGLKDGEVVVMQRNEQNEAVALTDVPSVESLRVDQLLTSEFFGLYSTVDPTLDQLFDDYYFLKAKPHRTKADQRRLGDLEKELAGKQALGENRRERIVLDAADEYLAKERRTIEPGERLALKEETRQKIVDVWERVAAGRRV